MHIKFLTAATLMLSLSGCGTTVPEFVVSADPNATAIFINRVVNHVKCELRQAYLSAHDTDIDNSKLHSDPTLKLPWLDSWGADVTLSLTVKEQGSLGPNVKYTKGLGGATKFLVGGGAGASAETTRVAKIDFFLPFSQFLAERSKFPARPKNCIEDPKLLIDGDLKFASMITDLTFPYTIVGNVGDRPPTAFSEEVTFAVTVNADLTPGWSFTQVDVNPSGTLLSASRVRTNDVVVSLGAADPKFPYKPSFELQLSHDQAVQRSSFQNSLR
jgi:hypothetical protein